MKYNIMKEKTNLSIWEIPLITILLYVIVVLVNYGYLSYFDVPSSMISTSISTNITLIYSIIKLFCGVFLLFTLLNKILWISLIIFTICVPIIFKKYRIILIFLIIILSGILSYNFGNFIAKISTVFPTIPASCLGLKNNNIYIIPFFSDTKVVLKPLIKNNNGSFKMLNSYLIRDTINLPCEINSTSTGLIMK